jgi:hypothetical protein
LKEAESLQNNGFNLTILCWDRHAELIPEETLPSGIKIIRIQNIPSSYGIGSRQLFRIPKFWLAVQPYLKTISPHIIHCHDFDTLPAGLWFGLFHHIPVIYDAHEYYAELVKPRLHGIMGWLLYRIIKLSEQFGAHYSRAVVTVDDTLATVYQKQNRNVIILGHYPEKKMAGQRNPVFSRPYLTLIYAGRLSVDRGILLYVDMVQKLQEKGIPTRLILAGIFTPESEKLKFNVYAKDVISSITYMGWIPYEKISQVYRDSDIGLAVLLPEPRYVAATPIKLYEYMACGLPVIASDFPSISAIVDDAKCGLLVDPRADLSETIKTIEFWWQNSAIPQSLGEGGRKAILLKFNWEYQSNCLVKLYRDLS